MTGIGDEIRQAFAVPTGIATPFSAREGGMSIDAAYAAEEEFRNWRASEGRALVGRKVGYANKAMWRVLKLDTLVWAHMYDDTVQYAVEGRAEYNLSACYSPRIEPEVVLRVKDAIAPGESDAAKILEAVEWIAFGFEIIDCPYPDWKFQPVDFVAAYGLHRRLIVGTPVPVDASNRALLAEELPKFTLKLSKNGEQVEEGSGKNSLRSPALCLAELATASSKQSHAVPLSAGELVSTGTLTNAQPIASGEEWSVTLSGLSVPGLSARFL